MIGYVAAHDAEQSAVRGIRVYAELRSDHIRLFPQLTPAECLYFDTNFDLVDIDIPAGFRRVSLLQAMLQIARSRARVLELRATTMHSGTWFPGWRPGL